MSRPNVYPAELPAGPAVAISERLAHRDRRQPDHLHTDRNRGLTTERSIWVEPATGIDWPHAAQVFLLRREVFDPLGQRVHREFVFGVTSRPANRIDATQLSRGPRALGYSE